jgi:excisionase family DNA binding protein
MSRYPAQPLEEKLAWMREREEGKALLAEARPDLLTVQEAARLLHVSASTARRMLRREPGVHSFLTPGSRRPILRIPREVIERILRRTSQC